MNSSYVQCCRPGTDRPTAGQISGTRGPARTLQQLGELCQGCNGPAWPRGAPTGALQFETGPPSGITLSAEPCRQKRAGSFHLARPTLCKISCGVDLTCGTSCLEQFIPDGWD